MQSKAEDQWTRSLPIVAERGKISDTNGATLAVSYTCYNIYTRAKEIKNPVEVAEILAKSLNLSFSSVFDKVSNRTVSEVLISNKVESDIALKIYKNQLDGVYITENPARYYPFGDLLTQVLGFTSVDSNGQSGIEAYFNDILCGTNGFSLVQSDLTGVSLDNKLEYFISASAGYNINLTIDTHIQSTAEQVLNKVMEEQKAKSASCIVMKTKTGEILAMSTKPSFDLNNIPREDVSYLMSTVKNQTVVDVYEPGSTFKILTMSIALETGKAKLSDTFYCPGYCFVDGEIIKCWKSTGHGSQTLAEGLANSCNCVFVELAQRIGLDTFYKYLYQYGYGTKSGIEISGESSGILMDKSIVKNVDLARMGFGQAVAVTPLQQITAVSAAVNGGYLYKPYLVKSITDNNGNTIQNFSPTLVRKVISDETSKIINDMLDLTVSKQIGKYTFVQGYAVGGKTGTTQKYENNAIAQGKYISSFVGTYPVDDPEYTILLMVDEPGAGAYFGSIVASPYAKLIFKDIFDYYNIPPDDEKMASKIFKSFSMPDFVDLSITEAVQQLSKLNLSYEIDGSGSKIVGQIPSASSTVFENDTVVIITN
ncbi:MAG: penicillin-binding transpeptidase domain-containing protein [Clostridia bacterium]|nr:penicillin-binding transpeptidase domain-containing protein [Clostridia bacterium]